MIALKFFPSVVILCCVRETAGWDGTVAAIQSLPDPEHPQSLDPLTKNTFLELVDV